MEIPVNNPGSLPKRTQREHRQHSRTKVIVTVELQPDGTSAPLRVETADLSIGGLYVEMMFTLEAGTKLKIVLWIISILWEGRQAGLAACLISMLPAAIRKRNHGS